MPKEDRDKRRKKKKKLRFFLISFVLIYLIFRSVPALYASNIKTTLIEEGSIEEAIYMNGLIVKNEKIYRSEGDGEVNTLIDEGERVKVGTKIAEITLNNDQSALTTKLNEINEKINAVEKINEESKSKSDSEKADQNVESLLYMIQKSIITEDYGQVSDLKEQLYNSIGKKTTVSGDDTLSSKSLDQLKEEREKLKNEIKNNTINYFSQEAGIVSFQTDGLEEVLNGNNINKYTFDDIIKVEEKSKSIKDNDGVNVGEPIFKIMDNYCWYLIAYIDEKEKIDFLEKDNFVKLVINDDNNRLKGRVIKINKKKGQAFVVFKFDSYFHNYYNLRNVDVKLIKSSNEGLKIPQKAICKKEGITGVYIKDTSGVIKFRPINILGKNDDFAIVSKGDSNNSISVKGSDKKVKTVKLFDEILLSGGKIKEGRIVD